MFNPKLQILLWSLNFYLFSIPLGLSQSTESIKDNVLFQQIKQLLEEQPQPNWQTQSGDLQVFSKILKHVEAIPDTISEQWFEARRALLKRNKGISAIGRFGYNDYINEGDVAQFGSRVMAGLNWDLLQGKSNQTKLQQINNEDLLHRYEQKMQARKRQLPQLNKQITYLFNQFKIEALSQRVAFLEKKSYLLYQFYHDYNIKYASIVELEEMMEQSRLQLETIQNINHSLEQEEGQMLSIHPKDLPIIIPDLEELNQDSAFANIQQITQALKIDQINTATELSRQRLKLSAFMQFNYRTYENIDEIFYPSIGVRASVPLIWDKAERNALAQTEIMMLQQQMKQQKDGKNYALFMSFQEYRYKLRQYVEFQYKLKKLKEKERIERILWKYYLPDEGIGNSPLRTLELRDAQFDVQLELIDLKKQLYFHLIKMYAQSQHEDFTDCLSVIDFDHIQDRLLGSRFIMLRKTDIETYGTSFLVEYLETNSIKNILFIYPNIRTQDTKVFYDAGFKIYRNQSIPIKYTDVQQWSGLFSYQNDVLVVNSFSTDNPYQLQHIDFNKFLNRGELEKWIKAQCALNPSSSFIIKNIELLIALDADELVISEGGK